LRRCARFARLLPAIGTFLDGETRSPYRRWSWARRRVAIPAEIPSFALKAAPVYRLEVGGAVFAAAYVVSMALVLALNNRAFSEIGMSGIKARDIGREQDQAIRRQDQNLEALTQLAEALNEDIPQDDEVGS
jgi:hypothetical protein